MINKFTVDFRYCKCMRHHECIEDQKEDVYESAETSTELSHLVDRKCRRRKM